MPCSAPSLPFGTMTRSTLVSASAADHDRATDGNGDGNVWKP
jgi:hypothetical protein